MYDGEETASSGFL